MATILSLLSLPKLAAGIVALFGIAMLYLRGRSDGKRKERGKQLEQEAQTRRKNDEIIDVAERARRNAGADDLMQDDGFKRTD